MIFKLKDYNHKKAFKLGILKIKLYVSSWYEHLKKNRLEKPNPKSKLGPNLRSIWTGDFYLLLTNKNFTSRSPLSTKRI